MERNQLSDFLLKWQQLSHAILQQGAHNLRPKTKQQLEAWRQQAALLGFHPLNDYCYELLHPTQAERAPANAFRHLLHYMEGINRTAISLYMPNN
ncbi:MULTISPECIES: hypothetical protein [Vibrio]|uniref:hypothetical protein n=1 Tax=Vibrio TaxID=662 RepID=UPI001BD6B474|nr:MULTISPECIES: hypothetical protein [Vibrio]EIK0770521.1 hypothetical protein [Vibrio alginolyticus]MBS9879787.1 hypothetical protein [Vibrio alginolyticus]MCA2487729.1 hypothetical protein [Vibrio alginolyticus]MDW1550146.1 hypothetical protein [Vibrio sp. YT-18]MDW1577920.1 hypothetical protein [Vibrio sp. Vb2880]